MRYAASAKIALCALALSLALPACKSARENTPTTEKNPHVAAPAETENPPPSKAEAAQKHDDIKNNAAHKMPATQARKLEDLRGTWVLDVHATAKRLPPEQRPKFQKILDHTAMSLSFDDRGQMHTEGASMGVPQEYAGTYTLERAQNNVLTLRVKPEDTTDEHGEIIEKGIPQTIEATFVDDLQLRWLPAENHEDNASPNHAQGMIFTRDPNALKEYDAQLERARVPRELSIDDLP